MRFETANFRIDYNPSDRFVAIMKMDVTKVGGAVAVGDVVKENGDVRYIPKRNVGYLGTEMMEIVSIIDELTKKLK